ncbi:hypothetical protein [Candidatus Uabimicrobium amorphum]|uniref:Uncharacterized protein n=1 Tax=Uabimicrobium amorphum TaxID=2596890 RepID=A0A5S9IMC9_UABAM|nr:hypothetical protein [Candidatus Uabimicrobium amorphum]BBM84190.1 hypothetical protein UABAM_02546 [Candidatus Uabimicrobium amorphum]
MFKFKFRLFPLGFITGMFDPEKLLEVIREGCQDGYRILRREFTFETRRKFGIFMLPAFGMVFRREEKNQDPEHDYRLATYCTRFFTRTVNLNKLQETLDQAADGGFEMYYAMKYPARFLLIFPREAYMFIFRKPYSGEGKQYKYFIQQTPYRFFTKTIDPQRYENELNESGAKGQIKRTFRDERRVFGIFRQQTVVAVFETTS